MREYTISAQDDGAKYLHLSITDNGLANGEQYRVPLAQIIPQLITEAPEQWPLVVKPIKVQLTSELADILDGLPVSQVMRLTELSDEQVEKLLPKH